MSQSTKKWNWPGSRWWSFDLHCHFKASLDYKGDKSVSAADWLAAARDAGLDAVAITDHNTASGIDAILDAVRDVEGAPVVFPGVELTASCGTHILAIAGPESTADHIKEILTKAQIDVGERGTRDARSRLSIENILDYCRGDDVLLIGAHVNGPKGILVEANGRAKAEILKHSALAAVEVVPLKEDGTLYTTKHIDPADPSCEDWLTGKKSGIPPLAKIWCSDSHSVDSVGTRQTWVKMTRPGVSGLRLAFQDGNDSVLPGREPSFDPNLHADNCIESVSVSYAKHIGRSRPLDVRFNPWFNSIIGGRGTGKSTVFDLIRKTLVRDEELGESSRDSLRADFENRMKVYSDRNAPGLLTKDTVVQVVYRKHDDRFMIEWRATSEEARVYRLPEGGDPVEEECNISKRFPIRLYSQKQLFHLAKEPNALFSVIDQSDAISQSGILGKLAELRQEYLSLRSSARLSRIQADELSDRRAELSDVKRRIEVMREASQGSKVADDYEERSREQNAWDAIKKSALRDLEQILEVELDILPVGETDNGEIGKLDPDLEAVRRDLDAMWKKLEVQISNLVGDVRGSLIALEDRDDFRRWMERVRKAKHEYSEYLRVTGNVPQDADQDLEALVERQSSLQNVLDRHDRLLRQAEECERKAQTVLMNIRQKRVELTRLRQVFAAETSDERVRISVVPYGDSSGFHDQIRETLGIRGFDRIVDGIVEKCFDDEEWSFGGLDGQVENWRILRESSAARDVVGYTDSRFVGRLEKAAPEAFDRLALYMPEDAVSVQFSDDSGKSWKNLESGSPGQQTAALLAFVLSYGSDPILLDQPEDDLDNTLICDLVVNRIRNSKRDRQVIVITHNPNIVVHGDVELVISLISRSGQTWVKYSGGMQEGAGREEICRVMEGGREVFRKRYSRIMNH